MIRTILPVVVLAFLMFAGGGCQKKEVALDELQFKYLLIDMHCLDAGLSLNLDNESPGELTNYAYYNGLFQKYGITRSDFDSCMHYYSAQSELFDKMYDEIIDSLNKQLTHLDRVLKELRANDSVNYFPTADTLCLDSVSTVFVDSIVPGLYKFSTTLKFDSLVVQRTRRISSFFLSEDKTDTLYVRDLVVIPDTNKRFYNWNQYVDSAYTQLVINYMEVIPWEKRPKVYKKGKWTEPDKKEKVYKLEDVGVKSWGNNLFRPYISRKEEQRWKSTIRHKKKERERE